VAGSAASLPGKEDTSVDDHVRANYGVYYSEDGGANWTQATGSPTAGGLESASRSAPIPPSSLTRPVGGVAGMYRSDDKGAS